MFFKHTDRGNGMALRTLAFISLQLLQKNTDLTPEQISGALENIEKYLAADYDIWTQDIHLQLAEYFEKYGNPEKAILHYTNAAELLNKKGELVRAIIAYRKIMSLDSRCLFAQEAIVSFFTKLGLTPEAEKERARLNELKGPR